MSAIISDFIREFHRHPLFGLFVAIWLAAWIGFSLRNFAWADDVNELSSEVHSIQVQVERSSLEQRIHAYEAEIYTLERLIAQGEARDMDYDRLSSIRSELGTTERKLARIQ